jgi:hypothetical protein
MILLGCLLILGGIFADYERDEFPPPLFPCSPQSA